MRLIVYCSEVARRKDYPKKVVAVIRGSSAVPLPVPRVGEHITLCGQVKEVNAVTYDYHGPNGIDVWVRLPTDWENEFKEIKL